MVQCMMELWDGAVYGGIMGWCSVSFNYGMVQCIIELWDAGVFDRKMGWCNL